MKLKLCKTLRVVLTLIALTSCVSRAADLSGRVQAANKPIAAATVTLYAADTGTPAKLAEAKTDDRGAFKLDAGQAPADSVLYVVAKGGTPKAAADRTGIPSAPTRSAPAGCEPRRASRPTRSRRPAPADFNCCGRSSRRISRGS